MSKVVEQARSIISRLSNRHSAIRPISSSRKQEKSVVQDRSKNKASETEEPPEIGVSPMFGKYYLEKLANLEDLHNDSSTEKAPSRCLKADKLIDLRQL
ncbi:MAG: hypothetical protein K2X27_14465 [Candidatus Obscuribacterales bacterium]|nr:hypothetical protein [Candidatus Obscuribacterales bacterium]